MKTHIVSTILICLTNFLIGQNFSKDYFEHCRPSWERQVTDSEKKAVNPKIDSMMFAATGRHIWEVDVQKEKQNAFNNIRYYKKIMKLKDLDIDKLQDFILIEESTIGGDWDLASIKNGVVIIDKQYFSYSINLEDTNSLGLNNSFLKSYDSIDKKDARSILFHLAKNNKPNEIEDLAIKEMNYRKPEYEPTKQYEVITYNRKLTKKVRLCYLHELLTDIYK
jgi:hypothetical protein